MTAAPVAEDIKTEGRHRIGYLPYLDGLRGVAILMVLIFHAGGGLMNGGFIGVDIFFVLSGYLITLLLIKEWDKTGRVHLGHFYMRRALRLMPAVMVMMALFVITGFGTNHDFKQRAIDFGVVFFYMANWARALGWPQSFELGHMWSLAIEEQFYLLWPMLFIALMHSRLPRRTMGWIVLGGAVLAAIWRPVLLIVFKYLPQRAYNGTDTRCDALLIGCAMAYLLTSYAESIQLRQRAVGLAANIAAVVLVAIAFTFKWQWPATLYVGFFLVAVASAVVVMGLQTVPNTALRRITEWPPLVKLGRISYGVYLWHWPVYHMIGTAGKYYDVSGRRMYVLFGGATASILIAAASYRIIESRFLKLKTRFQ